jgi:hypothetical protein
VHRESEISVNFELWFLPLQNSHSILVYLKSVYSYFLGFDIRYVYLRNNHLQVLACEAFLGSKIRNSLQGFKVPKSHFMGWPNGKIGLPYHNFKKFIANSKKSKSKSKDVIPLGLNYKITCLSRKIKCKPRGEGRPYLTHLKKNCWFMVLLEFLFLKKLFLSN